MIYLVIAEQSYYPSGTDDWRWSGTDRDEAQEQFTMAENADFFSLIEFADDGSWKELGWRRRA